MLKSKVTACGTTRHLWFTMFLGVALAILYIYIVYGFNHKMDQPLKRFNITVEPWLRRGSFFIFGHHLHHWIIAWALIPVAMRFSMYNLVTFLFTFGVHGFLYPDAFC